MMMIEQSKFPEINLERMNDHFSKKNCRFADFLIPEPVVDEISITSFRLTEMEDRSKEGVENFDQGVEQVEQCQCEDKRAHDP